MKIKEGFRLRKLGRDNIVVGEGRELVNFNKMVVLNSTAAYLWEKVAGKEFTVGELTELLTAQYDVSEETAAADARKLADEWIGIGIAEA